LAWPEAAPIGISNTFLLDFAPDLSLKLKHDLKNILAFLDKIIRQNKEIEALSDRNPGMTGAMIKKECIDSGRGVHRYDVPSWVRLPGTPHPCYPPAAGDFS
jgi:hypothetical protein